MECGWARGVITPDAAHIPDAIALAGYMRRAWCQGVHDDVHARALAFSSGPGATVVLVTLDLVGMDQALVDCARRVVARAVRRETGVTLPPPAIHLCCTHTHSGPDFSGFFQNGPVGMTRGFLFGRRRRDLLGPFLRRLARCAVSAIRGLHPVSLALTKLPPPEGLVLNRRHPHDPTRARYPLGVLQVRSPDGETLEAVVLNYACHGTVLPNTNLFVSADWPGRAVATLGTLLAGGRASGPGRRVFAAYFQGPCGDVNPLTSTLARTPPARWTHDLIYDQATATFTDVRRMGDAVARHVAAHLKEMSPNPDPNGDLAGSVRVHEFPVTVPLRSWSRGGFWAHLRQRGSYFLKYGLLKALVRLAGPGPVSARFVPRDGHLHARASIVQLGGIRLVMLPGEFFVALGRAIVAHAPPPAGGARTLVCELANDAAGYFFPLAEYPAGGYEPGLSFAPAAGTRVTREVIRQFRAFDS